MSLCLATSYAESSAVLGELDTSTMRIYARRTYFRSDDLTAVWVPEEGAEALGDLVRVFGQHSARVNSRVRRAFSVADQATF